MSSQSSSTITRHPRVEVADVLRGIAVMGIVVLHCIEHFNFYSFPDTTSQPGWLNFADRAIWDGMFFTFGGKAYAIFALLFGFSFFIQDDNQRMRGNDFRGRFAWRLFLLFVIGNINAVFFTAEILVLYSLVGFVLIAVCRLGTRTLLWLSAILLLQPIGLYYSLRAALDPSFITPVLPTGDFWAATYAQQSAGTFLSTLKVNIWEGQLASLAWAWDNGRVFQTAALFIIGMLIGRQGWFGRERLGSWGRVLAWALIAFFPLYGLGNMLPKFIENRNILVPLAMTVKSLYNFAFMLILVCGILFGYYCTTRLREWMRKLIPYGRMSMTNYVSQSIIGSFLFYNWGLGLHAYLGITASWFVGIALFFVQLAFCKWWMKAHTHGPLEKIWKKATWAI